MLSFVNNPIIRRQHYRLYVIAKLPQLKALDFVKVSPTPPSFVVPTGRRPPYLRPPIPPALCRAAALA